MVGTHTRLSTAVGPVTEMQPCRGPPCSPESPACGDAPTERNRSRQDDKLSRTQVCEKAG